MPGATTTLKRVRTYQPDRHIHAHPELGSATAQELIAGAEKYEAHFAFR
jgi:hypothetical protein